MSVPISPLPRHYCCFLSLDGWAAIPWACQACLTVVWFAFPWWPVKGSILSCAFGRRCVVSGEMSIQVLFPFSKGRVWFWLLSCGCSLYILDIQLALIREVTGKYCLPLCAFFSLYWYIVLFNALKCLGFLTWWSPWNLVLNFKAVISISSQIHPRPAPC